MNCVSEHCVLLTSCPAGRHSGHEDCPSARGHVATLLCCPWESNDSLSVSSWGIFILLTGRCDASTIPHRGNEKRLISHPFATDYVSCNKHLLYIQLKKMVPNNIYKSLCIPEQIKKLDLIFSDFKTYHQLKITPTHSDFNKRCCGALRHVNKQNCVSTCQKVQCRHLVFIDEHYNSPQPRGSKFSKILKFNYLTLLLCSQHHSPHPVIVLLGLPSVQSGAAAVLPQPQSAPEREVTLHQLQHPCVIIHTATTQYSSKIKEWETKINPICEKMINLEFATWAIFTMLYDYLVHFPIWSFQIKKADTKAEHLQ